MTKKALIVGIQYTGANPGELGGTVNDAKYWFNTATQKLGFPLENTRILLDPPQQNAEFPSKANIRKNLQWLTTGAVPGDVLFFFFAGHGINVQDDSHDEDDGMDEAIVCAEYLRGKYSGGDSNGYIRDDEINATLASLPAGVTVYLVFDCCHSGTMLDLPKSHHWDSQKTIVQVKPRAVGPVPVSLRDVKVNASKLPTHDSRSWFNFGFCGPASPKKEKAYEVLTFGNDYRGIKADVLAFTACKDDQTSIDAAGRGMMSICAEDAFAAVGHSADMITLFHAAATRCEQLRHISIFSPPNPKCTQYFQFACTPHSNPTLARIGEPIPRGSTHPGPQGQFPMKDFPFPLGPVQRFEQLSRAAPININPLPVTQTSTVSAGAVATRGISTRSVNATHSVAATPVASTTSYSHPPASAFTYAAPASTQYYSSGTYTTPATYTTGTTYSTGAYPTSAYTAYTTVSTRDIQPAAIGGGVTLAGYTPPAGYRLVQSADGKYLLVQY